MVNGATGFQPCQRKLRVAPGRGNWHSEVRGSRCLHRTRPLRVRQKKIALAEAKERLSSRRKVFVDTGAFLALFCKDDDCHEAATSAWASLKHDRVELITSNFVVDETITAVRVFAGHEDAVRAGDALFTSALLLRAAIDEKVETEAWAIFRKYDDQAFSFTDCTSFAFMRRQGIRTAFAFDSDFSTAGFEVFPPWR